MGFNSGFKGLNCLGSLITNDAKCTHETKSRIAMATVAFNKKKNFLSTN